MKAISAPLLALLTSGNDFAAADLWTITLSGGAVVRWSGADKQLRWAGQDFLKGPGIDRGQISEKIGLEVATLTMDIIADSADLINGVPLIPFIKNHGLDGANVKLERAFMPSWEDPITGTIIRFAGRITKVPEAGGSQANLIVSSWAMLLNTKMPADLYQSACRNSVYDGRCGLNRATFAANGTCTGTPTRMSFSSGLSATNNDYALGKVTFSTGANAGISRTIRANTGGDFTLVRPLPVAPAAGDLFTVYPGCDRTSSRCTTKFNNLAKFRAEEFVPQPETPL